MISLGNISLAGGVVGLGSQSPECGIAPGTLPDRIVFLRQPLAQRLFGEDLRSAARPQIADDDKLRGLRLPAAHEFRFGAHVVGIGE